MEKLILVSDVHGNGPALKALSEQEPDGSYAFLGDLHGLNAFPEYVTLTARLVGDVVLAGNHDKAIFHYGEGHVNSDALSRFELEHTLSALSDESAEWMRGLPFMEVEKRSGHRICYTHAMPYPEKASGYEMGNNGITKGSMAHVASKVGDDFDYVFHGHTHQQYEMDCSKFGHDVHFVNPGCLGYDGDYATVDLETGEVELKTVDFDHDAVTEHISSVLPEDAPSVHDWY